MDFYFYKLQEKNNQSKYEKTIVHVSLDDTFAVIRFEVDIDSLPIKEKPFNGYEVVAQFHLRNFNNNGTFYTDSNGLEMQKRVLNYRPSWNFKYSKNENISSNYYPIDSAISITEMNGHRKFIVMNDRSQGGSSLKDGTIELM